MIDKKGSAKLQRIAVLKEHRGKNFGQALVLGMEDAARKSGYKKSVLDAQVYARKFYEKLGYTAISEEIFDDAGIDHIAMQKLL